MYQKFTLLLFCLTIYSQFSIVVYGEDELRLNKKKKKKGQQKDKQPETPPTACIIPIPLQTYQPSYVHSGDQFQHSYIGSNQELRKKGKPTITDNKSGCVVVTAQTPTGQDASQLQLKKKKPNKFRPFKKRKKKKQQAQMIAQLEADLGIAFKDLMASLDYFWPKLQITFTTGTASIGHNIFSGIIPLMAAGMKIKKILFFMMDPMFSSMMYSLGYSHNRPRPKTSIDPTANTPEDEETQQDVQENDQTYAGSSSPVVTEQQFYGEKEEEDDEDEDEEDDEAEEQDDEDNEEDEEDEDQSEELDDNDAEDQGSQEQDDEEGEEYEEDTENSDQADDEGNVDYPAKDSAEVGLKRPKEEKTEDYLVGLKNIWDGMVTGFDELSMTGEF